MATGEEPEFFDLCGESDAEADAWPPEPPAPAPREPAAPAEARDAEVLFFLQVLFFFYTWS